MSEQAAATSWHLEPVIKPLFHDGGVVYIDSEAGSQGTLNRRQGHALLASCNLLDHVELDWPELEHPEPQLPQLIDQLATAGIITPGIKSPPDLPRALFPPNVESLPAGSMPMTVVLTDPRPPETALEKQADQSLRHVQTLVQERRFGVLSDEVNTLRGTAVKKAAVPQALEIAQAVRQVSDWSPGKFACYEHSLATVYIGALNGLEIELQFGASLDPLSMHAWPVAEGRPIVLPGDPSIYGYFHPIFKL